ncbi:MAG: uracil-DNA glycosylase, 4 family protein [Betaproteobacteria bacterium]|nr:uracil-DNA glycosylase, 4 family protein [Betaproteobacteria bacterium]
MSNTMTREDMLREMGITPLWKARAAAAEVQQAEPSRVQAVPPDAGFDEEPPPYFSDDSPAVQQRPAVVARAPARPAEGVPALVGVDPARVEHIARMEWPDLKGAVAECTACTLCKARKNTVFGVGDEKADWMIIGEAPGAEEDARGEPFVGQAGRLLDSMLAALEMKREVNVYIANVLKCRPPGNRNPEPLEVAQCSPHLLRQVALIQPKLIILMGRFAAQTLLHTDASIASMRGRLHQYQGTPAIVTYHPAYLLRNLPDKSKAWQDLLFARKTSQSLQSGAAAQ